MLAEVKLNCIHSFVLLAWLDRASYRVNFGLLETTRLIQFSDALPEAS